ncbi:MAG: recombination mediator RecR [Chlamydiae bacterium]|nr:recombination mediator RecR [Chlamydiota bacterium]
MSKYPNAINSLIAYLRKFPGVGSKTAERHAFQLLDWPDTQLQDFAKLLSNFKETIHPCPSCGCLLENALCAFCDPSKRDISSLCIIASPKDVYPIEETRVYKGLYHVIGGLLSPLDGKTPEDLHIGKLKERILKNEIRDVIIALDSTIEGDATALYLKEEMEDWGARVTRPAMGMPMGSSLDYIDGGTLARALIGRQNF